MTAYSLVLIPDNTLAVYTNNKYLLDKLHNMLFTHVYILLCKMSFGRQLRCTCYTDLTWSKIAKFWHSYAQL